MSLWEYLVDSGDEIASSTIAESLKIVHRALATYPNPLPSFRAALTLAEEPLSNDRTMRALPDADLALLRLGFSTLVDRLDDHCLVEQALHGEPHWATSSRPHRACAGLTSKQCRGDPSNGILRSSTSTPSHTSQTSTPACSHCCAP